jgi:hypothetical protein
MNRHLVEWVNAASSREAPVSNPFGVYAGANGHRSVVSQQIFGSGHVITA